MWLQGTRKIGCTAHIDVKVFTIYPQYAITKEEMGGLTEWKLRSLKKEKIDNLKSKLAAKAEVLTELKYFVSIPSNEAHSDHPIGEPAIHTQKIHPIVAQKIIEMVMSGMTDCAEIRRSLRYYVNNFLTKEIGKPHPYDRAFYPLKQDIANHISQAKRAIDLSKFDQENLHLKVEEWKRANPKSSFYFRPFGRGKTLGPGDSKCEPCENDLGPGRKTEHEVPETSSIAESEQGVCEGASVSDSLLYVHQEEWQRDLLKTYGNTITLMDATYKTTKYSIPLFFLCVKTNVNYTVIAEFVIQSESADKIFEALSVIKTWVPNWDPKYFITDYSDAEMGAIKKLFPNTQLYLCEFHREQAWERWVKDRKHGLSESQASLLLDLLRDCANAPVNTQFKDEPLDHLYKLAHEQLIQSDVYKENKQVQQWLTTMWFSCPNLWARAYRDQTYHAVVNTTNGVESQNKLLKYSYLPRKKISLSRLATVLCEEFNPDIHHKYLFLNFKASSNYRTYNDFVPSYLHGRPRQVIIHCLDRKSSSRKYDLTDIVSQDTDTGVFTIKGSSTKSHIVDFGTSSGEPSCTCLDWIQWRIPCKHFFAIFNLFEKWGWESLPTQYKCQPHISTDMDAVSKAETDISLTHVSNQADPTTDELMCIDQNDLPVSQVS